MWLSAASLEYIILSVGRSVLFYPWGALWYIQALIVATFILIPFIKKGKEVWALLLGIILYFFALLCNRYFFVVEDSMLEPIVRGYLKVFASARNGVFMGLMYVTMGIVIAKRWRQQPFNKPYWLSLLLFSCVMLFFEVYSLSGKNSLDDGSLFVSAIFLIPTLFVVSAQYNLPIKQSRLFRNLSTSIYLLHYPIRDLYSLLLGTTLGLNLPSYAMFLLVLIAIFIICGLVYPKKKQPYYDWIV